MNLGLKLKLLKGNSYKQELLIFECTQTIFHTPSPVVSMRAATLTVSPNRQYLGIVVPTTPATTGPEWTPIRILICCWLGRILNVFMCFRMSKDMRQISLACCFWLRMGSPLTTMYASPIVSTCVQKTKEKWINSYNWIRKFRWVLWPSKSK